MFHELVLLSCRTGEIGALTKLIDHVRHGIQGGNVLDMDQRVLLTMVGRSKGSRGQNPTHKGFYEKRGSKMMLPKIYLESKEMVHTCTK